MTIPSALVDGAAFQQVLALFAGKGEGEDGIGFVTSASSAVEESGQQTVGVVLDSTSFYAEGGGQVRHDGIAVWYHVVVSYSSNDQLHTQGTLMKYLT